MRFSPVIPILGEGLLLLSGWPVNASTGRARTRPTGPLVALSQATGRIVASGPAFNAGATVSAVAADGRGGWWVGGTFAEVGGFHCPYLVHLLAGLKIDRRWCPHADNSVQNILVSGSTLFVSGQFTRFGAVRRPHLAAVDALTGKALGWNPHPDNSIGSMGRVGSTLYVSGYFSHLGGKRRLALGAVDVRTGAATAWDPEPDTEQHGDSVHSLAVGGSVVFVDGWFSHVGGAARDGFAALDSKKGKATPFRLRGDNVSGYDPLVANGKLYLDTRSGIPSRFKSVAFDLPGLARDKHWSLRFVGIFAVDSRHVYASAEPGGYGDVADNQEQVVALDATSGTVRWRSPIFSDAYNPTATQGSSSVVGFAVASSPSFVLVGGNFQRVQG